MKKIIGFLIFLVITSLSFGQNIVQKQEPPRLVNDFAKVLSPIQAQILEDSLVAFSNNTSNQIVIVTLNSLEDYPIEDYATKLFREWAIGQATKNNGVLLLISIQDRKIKIETGYGLEGALPDIICKKIIRDYIKPSFKKQDYFAGIMMGVTQIKKAAIGEFNDKTLNKNKGKNKTSPFIFILLLIAVFVILSLNSRHNKKNGGHDNNGGSGLGSLATGFLIGSMLSGGRSYGGGGYGGGDSGGFGGFGGGSSGGGGASGDW